MELLGCSQVNVETNDVRDDNRWWHTLKAFAEGSHIL